MQTKKYRLLQFATITSIVTFLLTSLNSYSQENWDLLNPTPSYLTGKDVHFVSNSTGYILNSGELLETTDSGITWTIKQNIPSGNDINFYNNTGYIVGNGGYVLKSTNGGDTWSQVNIGNGNFNTVNFIDQSIVIISSENQIIKTENDGATWITQNIPNGTVNKTFFVNSLVGHAACDDGTMLKTVDGGLNWYLTIDLNFSPSDFFTVHFASENVGYATREHSTMHKTTDGGETWFELNSISDAIYAIQFFDENTGYAVGEHGVIFRTTDGGNNWTWLSFQQGRIDNTDINGLFFFDVNNGFAVGNKGRIIRKVNAGTWIPYSPFYRTIRTFQLVNGGVGYLSYLSTIFKTTDGGETWVYNSRPAPNGTAHVTSFDFVNNSLGYALLHGSVYKTTDGGMNWTETNNGNAVLDENLYSIDFVTENIGYVSGGFNSDRVLKTVNGGDTWQALENISFGQMQFLNEDVGYARNVGNAFNRIYKTIDGGISWEETFEIQDDIYNFHFVDENIGFFVGDDGLMRKTFDGGSTWQSISIPYADYDLVQFYSEQLGFVVDDYGKLYKTIDGGESWEQLPNFGPLSNIKIKNSTIYLAGINGRILRSGLTGPLGIVNFEDVQSFIKLYPNPAKDEIMITTEDNSYISKVKLYSTSGKLITTETLESNLTIFNLSLKAYSRGLYLLEITTNEGKLTTKKVILD